MERPEVGLPPFLQCLISGGDERIDLDPATGLNRYGIGPIPNEQRAPLGSVTASTISSSAFSAVRTLYDGFQHELGVEGEQDVYLRSADQMRQRIAAALLTRDTQSVDVVLGSSGTDLHLLAALLFNGADARPLCSITLDASETGRAVATASQGQHFTTRLPDGSAAMPGSDLDKRKRIRGHVLAARTAGGLRLSESAIERDLDIVIKAAVQRGMRCLLVMVDVTKTGLIVPSLRTAIDMKRHYGEALDIIVDACQMRLSPTTLDAYLSQGFPVIVTGSKFMGGPPFCGALLLPPGVRERLRPVRLPKAAEHYSAAGDWPREWAARDDLTMRSNFGLLLRWHAALDEWTKFQSVPSVEARKIAADFASAVTARLLQDPAFYAISCRSLDRSALLSRLAQATSFDGVQTIFPFLVARTGTTRRSQNFLDMNEAAHIRKTLYSGALPESLAPFEVGQPVFGGFKRGYPVAALRLSLGARLIVRAHEQPIGTTQLANMAMQALDGADQARPSR